MLPQHIQADDFESLKTVSGKVLSYKDEDPRLVLALAQRYEIPEIIARILIKRGITLDTAHLFLNPTLKQLLPNPFDLKDINKGMEKGL